MRTGPHPLPTHIGLAASMVQGGVSQDNVQEQVARMLQGIKKYQRYGELPAASPLSSVFMCGNSRVLYSAAGNCLSARPVFLVPSLINKYHVFDLHPQRSFVRWLNAQGYDVYLLDWGDLCVDDGAQTVEEIVRDRLNAAAAFVVNEVRMPVHAIGYCMGGTLLAGGACLMPDLYYSLSFIAAPWDFFAVGPVMREQLALWAPSVLSYVALNDRLPCSHIQSLFAALYPAQTVQKFSRFLDMEAGSEEEQIFVAVEDWLNDGVDLPRRVAQDCIQSWFIDNAPFRGDWHVDGQVIAAENIRCPAYIVASDRDKLVADRASRALYNLLPGAEFYNPSCGHIGMMAGRDTVTNVWEPISAWIAAQNTV